MLGEQLCLGIDRPIQERPQREPKRRRSAPNGPASGEQLEFRSDIPDGRHAKRAAQPEPIIDVTTISRDCEHETQRERFGAWLLTQTATRGTLGDLAKAAKLDRQFPKAGSVEEVRARFGALGADGDAYEALEDAERVYERLAA